MTEIEGEAPAADSNGQELDNRAELLFRQVNPKWVEDGTPSSQAFGPTKKDEGKLSIALSSKTDAEGAYRHYVEVLGLASAGTWAVTVGEAIDAGRKSFAEPLDEDPAHGFVDFRDIGRKAGERVAKVLLAHAFARGQLFASQTHSSD